MDFGSIDQVFTIREVVLNASSISNIERSLIITLTTDIPIHDEDPNTSVLL